MQQISMDKKYKTRSGLPVRILCVDRMAEGIKFSPRPVIALVKHIDHEVVVYYHIDGSYRTGQSSDDFDLIEISPYDDYQIGDWVFVTDDIDHNPVDREWFLRKFAGVTEDGYPLATLETFSGSTDVWWKHCVKVIQNEV